MNPAAIGDQALATGGKHDLEKARLLRAAHERWGPVVAEIGATADS